MKTSVKRAIVAVAVVCVLAALFLPLIPDSVIEPCSSLCIPSSVKAYVSLTYFLLGRGSVVVGTSYVVWYPYPWYIHWGPTLPGTYIPTLSS